MNQVFWPCSLLEVYREVWERRVYIPLILYVHDYRHQDHQGIRRGIPEYGMWQYKHGRGMVGEDFIVAYSLHWQRWVICESLWLLIMTLPRLFLLCQYHMWFMNTANESELACAFFTACWLMILSFTQAWSLKTCLIIIAINIFY